MLENSVKRITFLVSFLFLACFTSTANNDVAKDTVINPPLITSSYNDTIYNSVIESAMGIAQPYLLQQKYYTMNGVTVSGNSIVSNGVTYPVTESYFNPGTGYYIASTSYATYGISNFKLVWPTECPNAFYDSSTSTFSSKIDCVGFGTRLLSAVGGTSSTANAYLNLLNRLHTNNVTPFASKGFVATAYQFGVGFPTLKTAPKPGWEYVSGNICATNVIDGYNHVIRSTVGNYNGVRKGGFGLCQAGDVLAFAYDSTASSNGHWMVIESTPILLNATSLQTYYPKASTTKVKAFIAAHRVYAVPVIDDSGKSAHFNDSRSSYSGIGHGTVLIVADTTDDAPVGFIFSPSTSITYSPIDTSHCYAISVGRFTSASQLPVTLASFEVKEQNNIVNLNWQTSSELNTSYFNLQHSTDGINYTTLSTVKAKGSGVNYYTSNDVNPNNGVNYYRLQVVDRIGEISYSKQIVIKFTTSKPVITLFPNPSKGVITVKGSHICHITAMDNLGRIVFAQSYNDVTNPIISLSELNRGVYHLLIQTFKEEVNSSFIKE